jgi:type I restriction enzyme S subunit
MDSEIAVVGESIAKAKNFKQAMMQELLTGRVRLV